MGTLLQDVRFAVRTLRKGWVVTGVAVASLAVAIGGNATVFSLVNAVLWRPSSVAQPERVALVQERQKDQSLNFSSFTTSLGTWAELQERVRSATEWAAFRNTTFGLRGPERSEPISGAEVSAGFLDLIGVAPRRGRGFFAEEAVQGGPRVAVVRPEFWERQRGGEGDPLGQTLVLNGEPHEVVGVLPADFRFLFTTADVLVPLTDDPIERPRDRRDIVTLARLAPGATMERLEAEVASLALAFESEYAESFEDWTLDVFNFREDIPNAQTKTFYGLLQGSVFFVLLIACANITNLLIARGRERSREIALRSVLGAGRARIVRQLMTESGLLVAGGTVLGLGLGWYGIRLMAGRLSTVIGSGFVPTLNGRVVLFTLAVGGLAGILFGLVPALQTFRRSHVDALKEGGGKSSAGRSRKLLSRTLVVAEIALSLMALGGGGMLVRSFLELRGGDPGFDPAPILTAQLRMPSSKLPDDEQALLFLDRALERAGSVEGVRAASLVNVLPQGFGAPTDTFRVRGRAAEPGVDAPQAFALRASPGYLETFGIELLQGRFFRDADRVGEAPVVVVNRSFVETFFPDESPVGRSVDFRGESREIVGVVEDVRQVLIQTPGGVQSEAIYVPAAQSPQGTYRLAVRASGDPERLTEPIRATLQEIDPDLTIAQLLTMEAVTEQAFVGVNIFNTILGSFGILALLLASVGTYGVLAYSVSQRRHEIGIRMAIGAQGGEVVRMVAKQGVVMALLGLGIGGLLMLPLTRVLRSLLEGIGTVSGDTAVIVAGVLFSVTLVASLVPAYRASATDPVRALREE